jgi:hypothetical protein
MMTSTPQTVRKETKEMDQVQERFVAEYIRELDHDAVADRAEPAVPRETAAGPRRRVGMWLINVGEAIAGRSPDVNGASTSHDPMGSAV